MMEDTGAVSTIPNYDLHNHTVYSGHADEDATVLNVIARASELRLDHIGISEHVMQAHDVGRIETIRSEIDSLFSMGAQPLLGVEMDIDPACPDGRWVCPGISCDYVIISPHAFPQFDLDIPSSELLEVQRKVLIRRWMQWYRNAIERGGCAILGHPLREPLAMNLLDLSDPEMIELAIDTFRPAINQGIAFELNNAFLTALSSSSHYPAYLNIVSQLRAMGMRFSRGSDSHGTLRVGACEAIEEVANFLGFTSDDWIDIASLITRRVR